jgi:FKBP-type peptidyl-prolyl cis-trans isomerase
MTEQEMVNTIQTLQSEMKAKRAEETKTTAERNKDLPEKNKKESETFLAENAKKEGVVTLPSGLQYKIIKEGTGKQPAKTDKVKIHYRSTFANGAEFYNSYKSGQPVIQSVDKFIKGLSEGLQLMKEGSKWILYIPSDLAYGRRGAGRAKGAKAAPKTPLIGPNQTLIFEVELISIE